MLTKVIKRKGHIEDFDSEKIEDAIINAAKSSNSKIDIEYIYRIREKIINSLSTRYMTETPSVEAIQDEIEKSLIHHNLPEVAKSFILYRKQKTDEREGKYLIDVMDLVDGYINQSDWRVRENANSSYSVSGLMFHIAGAVSANYALNKYPKNICDSHKNGDLHIHDLSFGLYTHYCAGFNLEQLFTEGINKIPGKINSNPANHLTSATWQMINFIGTLQNEQSGAVAYSDVSTHLAPFIKKDNLDYKKVKQAMQGLIFNLNVPSRFAMQAPFSNFTLNWTIPKSKIDDIPIIGGKPMDFTYGDLEPEMHMINKAFMDVLIEGDATGKPFSVHPEEKIIIKDNNGIKLIPIGNFVDDYIPEENGIKNIKNIEALSLNKDTLTSEFKNIKQVIKHKEKNTIYEIETKCGNNIKITKSHSIFSFDNGVLEPKKVEDLKQNDIIVSIKKIYPTFKHHRFELKRTNKEKYYFGEYIDESDDLLWLIGFFAGNGNIIYDENHNLKGIELSTQNKKTLLIIENKIQNIFNKINICKSTRRISLISKQIAKLFYDFFNGNHYAHNKHVPDFVFNSRYYNSFIDGYFTADGVKQINKIRTVSKNMYETLPALMLYNGYKCKKHIYDSKCWDKPRYQMTFTKTERINNLFNIHNHIKNICKTNDIDFRIFEKNSHYRYMSLDKIKWIQKILLDDYNINDNVLNSIINSDIHMVEIKNIKKIKYNGPVYDLSVENNESFVSANSILLHNTFPIPTINITDSFDWDGPNTDELFDVTSKYGSFYFANLMNSDIKEEDIYSMCCRLKIDMRKLRHRGGGLFGSNPNTGSIGIATLNLPIYSAQSKDESGIFELIDKNMEIAKNSLEIKREHINRNMDRGLMPYTKRFIGTYKNHFSTIGLIGMHEMLMDYMDVGIWDKDAHNLAMKIMDHMNARLIEFQEETGNLYNLEATPAEGTSRRLAAISRKLYPNIAIANPEGVKEGAAAYFTNSVNHPVGYTSDLFESLDLESPLLEKFTGGCVKHIYLGERLNSSESAKNLVRKVCENYKVPYISVTPNFSICPIHGYISGEHKTCPCEK